MEIKKDTEDVRQSPRRGRSLNLILWVSMLSAAFGLFYPVRDIQRTARRRAGNRYTVLGRVKPIVIFARRFPHFLE